MSIACFFIRLSKCTSILRSIADNVITVVSAVSGFVRRVYPTWFQLKKKKKKNNQIIPLHRDVGTFGFQMRILAHSYRLELSGEHKKLPNVALPVNAVKHVRIMYTRARD